MMPHVVYCRGTAWLHSALQTHGYYGASTFEQQFAVCTLPLESVSCFEAAGVCITQMLWGLLSSSMAGHLQVWTLT